jgi:hypothetical protein
LIDRYGPFPVESAVRLCIRTTLDLAVASQEAYHPFQSNKNVERRRCERRLLSSDRPVSYLSRARGEEWLTRSDAVGKGFQDRKL